MAKICLVEDDAAVRDQLVLLLQHAGHEVSAITRFDNLPADILAADPDAVILDLGLPGTDGQYVARALRQQSSVPLMVLTSRTSELDELMSLTMGADNFVQKSTNPQLILARLDALLRRGKPSGPSATLEEGGLTLDTVRSQASYGEKTTDLSRNELRILELLMRRKGGICSREDLMEALWTSEAFVDDNTLTVNVNRLRQTLSHLGLKGAVVTFRGQGYALRLERA